MNSTIDKGTQPIDPAAPSEPRTSSALAVLFYITAMFLVLAQIATHRAMAADGFLWLLQAALSLAVVGRMIDTLERLVGVKRG
jgi:hypothetical protein